MFERFTARARTVLTLAQEEADLLGHNFVGTEHLLLGLVHEGEGIAGRVMHSLGVTLDAARDLVGTIIPPSEEESTEAKPFTPRAKKVLELSLREALQLGHNYIGTEHILLGLVREGKGVAVQVLRDLAGDMAGVRSAVIDLLSSHPARRAEAQPPLCQYCDAELETHAKARRMTIADDSGGVELLPATFVYCDACGHGLLAHVDLWQRPPSD